MKAIFKFFRWLFGYGKPDFEKTNQLVNEEVSEIAEIENSVKEIRVIYEEITSKLDSCSPAQKKELVINPRLSTSQLRLYMINNGVLEIGEMSRKEKQFYAKKIYFLRYKRGMKIVFDKTKNAYKYFKNGL